MTTVSSPGTDPTYALRRGSLSRVPIGQAAPDTLLSFAVVTDPYPPLVGTRVALSLAISNPTRQPITCSSIDVALPVGMNAKDLTPEATGIVTSMPDDWDVSGSGGVFRLTPRGDAGTIGGDGVVFLFSQIRVNDEPGTAAIRITETASSVDAPVPAPRATTIPVPKFPARFSLSDLTVVSPPSLDVPSGGTATLMWTGTGEGVTFTLRYKPADAGPSVAVSTPDIGATGPYVSVPLSRSGSVMFALTAYVKIPGQDQPATVQRLAFVNVQTMSLAFVVLPPTVGVRGLVRLHWNAPNADHCMLDDGSRLEPAGDRYVVLATTRKFTITAYNARGIAMQQLQSTVTVDPTIVANLPGPGTVGRNGGRGALAQCPRTWGGRGEKGEDAVLRHPIPLLDVSATPRRVIPITLTGGRGGDGGSGTACSNPRYPRESWALPGGAGGDGGDAAIDSVFDSAAGEPAQYIVLLTPGAGGAGGTVEHVKIDPGASGKPGQTYIRIRDPE